jgi:DNA-binding CsgD family transcriptional regulator
MEFDEAGRKVDQGGLDAPAAYRDDLSNIAGKADRASGAIAMAMGSEAHLEVLVEPLEFEGDSSPGLLLWLRSYTKHAGDPPVHLMALHGLSRMEARLAWALCQGSSLNEAAEELGLTRETARNYSKRIYTKVGARGQADLVRLILTGIAPLG